MCSIWCAGFVVAISGIKPLGDGNLCPYFSQISLKPPTRVVETLVWTHGSLDSSVNVNSFHQNQLKDTITDILSSTGFHWHLQQSV